MKVAYSHLINFLSAKPSIKDLSDKLFQLGHEHEIHDSIFDMELTPNRGDCLSLQGLARDLNIFYGAKIDTDKFKEAIPPLDLNFINNAISQCPQISFLNIEIKETIKPYNSYLDQYFKDLKINKNNFFTDISNYIAYETGQPTHSYDFDKIDKNQPIILQEHSGNLMFKSLTGKDIELNESNLVFTNNNKVINLAGIMGNLSTSCSQDTTNALIECAYFKPESIIGKAVKYDLHSDASHKFERNVDPLCHDHVLRRFIQIVDEHADLLKISIVSFGNNTFNETEIDINHTKINSILGTDFSLEQYLESISKLGFVVNKKISTPSYRSDIKHQNDLAEELGRVIGYDNLPRKNIDISVSESNDDDKIENIVRSFLINNGFYEVINFPFVSAEGNSAIKVDNPLDSNKNFLRTNILESLMENLEFNEKRQKDSIRLFEISDIYSLSTKIVKTKRLGVIASGRVGNNYLDFSKKIDLNYIKSLFEEVLDTTDIDFKVFERSELNTKTLSEVIAFEIDLNINTDKILNLDIKPNPPTKIIKYSPISEFPSTYRDISYSVDDYKKIYLLQKKIELFKNKLLKNVFVFDFFENTKINLIKIGFRFTFQSKTKTLTDAEVDIMMDEIIASTLQIDGIKIPGLN